jgi:hypothetical protein
MLQFNSFEILTFLVHRYLARYYVNDKKLKVQLSRQNYLAVFLLDYVALDNVLR